MTLTAGPASREFDFRVVKEPLSKGYFGLAEWDGGPGLETAVSVQVEAEEIAVTDGVW